VVPPGGEDQAAEALTGLSGWRAVAGGATRAASVQAGLAALSATDDTPVLIHDAARPFLTLDHITRLLDALTGADAALLALPVPDTLTREGADGLVAGTEPRDHLWRAQTPQAARLKTFKDAFAVWPGDETPTDDAAVVERTGGTV